MSAEVGGAAVIVVDDAAKDIAALDRASVLGLAVGDGGALVNALMRASNVVIAVGELAQHPLQMDIIEDEKMIEAFLSGGVNLGIRCPQILGSTEVFGTYITGVDSGTDPSFREGIRFRGIVNVFLKTVTLN